ncbi:hypothetical protein F2P56_003403 [Juglans regia]|uniref:Cytochrome P450 71A1-like n=2 Tax=Juglans regia TaxID=51240 RepID=A0A833Y697_JUGRE|nr:cytochrome P450 71A1-like [Juglans regia]KAF5476689.1 hypothetical protein F2P56_003403 [Juglans regia]
MALPTWFLPSWQELPKIPVSPFLYLIFIFSFLFAFKSIFRSRKANLPPSPPKLPIIGNLHQLGTLPHRSFQALSKKYGPVMLLHLGHAPSLVVSSADMAREVMKTHDITFSNRPRTTAADILLYGCTDIGFASYGEYWRQVRKICVLELLSLRRVQSFQYVREEEVLLLTNRIRESCLKQTSVNLSEMFFATSNNIVSRCTLGQKYEGGDGKSRFGQLARRVVVLLTAFCVRDFFPSLGWIDVLTGLIPSLKAVVREIDPFLDQVVEEHRKMRSDHDHDQPNYKKDFVDILLQLQDQDGMLDYEFTQDNLKAILLDMFLGGSETSSTTLEWLMAELIKNPNIMERAQEDVRRVVGNKLKIDENDIHQMCYLKCVLKETLRLHPPAPLLLPRETSSSVKLGGYDIPPKTKVFVNTWAIQRDPTVWERAEEFLPERFIDNPIDFRGQDFEFLPFGGGRRGCPGLIFSVAAVEYVIANILCWFDWRMPSASVHGKDHLDMGEVYGVTVSKKVPLHLVPTLHSL